ncbi:peroxiredoxin [Paenisporosarcina sp. TG20]|uniref:peroxiredoxin family protein n=1 Tax=Paenisporosarcina sp. TG20 TaxID=1211706 RepID=UPI0003165228|nr:peroxiredoxin family protein [Paenisporosarcina sp. TG20]
MNSLKLGTEAPLFNLPEASGGTYSLEQDLTDRKGWRFILFFRGTWCSVCKLDLSEIEESKSYFDGKNIHFTAISTDTQQDSTSFKEELNLSFPILSDAPLNLLNQYGVFHHGEDAPYEDHGTHGEAAYFLLDEKGNILYQQKQTSPFGRPNAKELRKIVTYIKKNLKD